MSHQYDNFNKSAMNSLSQHFHAMIQMKNDCTKLKFYETCLSILTDTNVSFWSRSAECEGCTLKEITKTDKDTNIILEQTFWPIKYEIRNDTELLCKATHTFKEHGKYVINVSELTGSECLPKLVADPDDSILPIVNIISSLLMMIIVWYIILWPNHIVKYWAYVKNVTKKIIFQGSPKTRKMNEKIKSASIIPASSTRAEAPAAPKHSRIRSLDTFRGATILIMIFVHAGGYNFAWFRLSAWNGLTFVDTIFPGFAFAMGEALALTIDKRLRAGITRTAAMAQVIRRSLLLVGIGLTKNLVYGGSLRTLQLTGIMQRLGAMYLIVGVIECTFYDPSCDESCPVGDLLASWRQWLLTLALVAVQVGVSLGVASPGCPRGYLGPGGLHRTAQGLQLHNCTGGIAGHIDSVVLGTPHLWKWNSTAKSLYESSVGADSMGLLGCLSGLLMVQAGAHAYRIMNTYKDTRYKILVRWLLWSKILGFAGCALCGFSRNEGLIPINKTLTSVSYCLVTSAIAYFVRTVLYVLVDWKKVWGGRPLCYAGQNSLFLYVGSEMLPLRWYIAEPTHPQIVVPYVAVVLVWLAVAVLMHRYRIIITV